MKKTLIWANGLICLKGGDLAAEISQSDVRPNQIALTEIFNEDYFNEKYLLYVKNQWRIFYRILFKNVQYLPDPFLFFHGNTFLGVFIGQEYDFDG